MKSIIYIIMAIALCSMASAITDGDWFLCGDGTCDNDPDYNESAITTMHYCPADCGVLTSSEWCEDTYSLIALIDCPSSPACPGVSGGVDCTVSSISNEALQGWCAANTGAIEKTPFPWWLLVIGFVAGFYYYKYKRRQK